MYWKKLVVVTWHTNVGLPMNLLHSCGWCNQPAGYHIVPSKNIFTRKKKRLQLVKTVRPQGCPIVTFLPIAIDYF